MSVNKLQQILKPKCILDTLFFKTRADDLLAIFTNTIKINPVKSPVKNQLQQNNWQHPV